MAYHLKEIPKGKIGEFSKIKEEFLELEDAVIQKDKILQICELTDLIGAIKLFSLNNFCLSLDDLINFNKKTEDAFLQGKRK